MKKSRAVLICTSIILLAAVLYWRIATPSATADDVPPLGDSSNWDSNGVEWQYSGSEDGNSPYEYWTYYLTGTITKTIGPGLQLVGDPTCSGKEFSCATYEEVSQDVYAGKIVFSEQVDRSNSSLPINIHGPIDIWFDQSSLLPRQRFQKAYTPNGYEWQQVWNQNRSGAPLSRSLSGGETWSYQETSDPAAPEWVDSPNTSAQDECNDSLRQYTVEVSSSPSNRTVNGMTVSCYRVTRTGRGNIHEYWDEWGMLAGPFEVDGDTFYDDNQLDFIYQDFPGDPVVYTCDSNGVTKTSFASVDHIYVTGHWMTVNHANSRTSPDNTYDIWVGQGVPSGDLAAAGYTDTGIDANVLAAEPGSFGPLFVGTASSMGISGSDIFIVLDDDDGTYHGDTNTFELSGVAYGSQVYKTGSSSYDDGLFGPFSVGPAPVDVEINVNLQGENRPASGWEIPISIGFFPANSGTLVMSGSSAALYWFEGITSGTVTESGTKAYFQCPTPVNPGTYDITTDSTTTLLNVKRNVGIW